MAEELDLVGLYRRAEQRLSAGDVKGALEDLQPVVEAEPNTVSVLLLLARAYFKSAQLARAEQTYRRVVELHPAEPEALIGLARTLERQSRHAEALPHARMAASMRPQHMQTVQRIEQRLRRNNWRLN